MHSHPISRLATQSLVGMTLVCGGGAFLAFAQTPPVDPSQPPPLQRLIRKTTNEQRRAAAANAAAARAVAGKAAGAKALASGTKASLASYPQGTIAPPGVMNPRGTPDYMSGLVPNWANSPAIRKFVDTLPGLGPQNANNLGNYIPIASKDTSTYPGSDYYNIAVVEYTQKLHSDLPATKLRGYRDLAGGDGKAHYLGPVIIANRDKAVRVKFQNLLPSGAAGNLFIPVDTSSMGAGDGPGGGLYTENRAELHLHGGLSPWISDGTPHQWLIPATDPSPFKRGASFRDVPDMPATTPGDGTQYYYWTNQQSGRFMFYHDHSYGITRLNVYAGEAAGYLITDPVEEKLIDAGIIPGAAMPPEYRYGIPLIIQDKTFVPGPTALAQQDPTWDLSTWGGYGDLWYPHVYMPNQNPADPSGANAMGRWDYGPWFWPPVPVGDVAPGSAPTSIPLANGPKSLGVGQPDYPGTPNPSLVPEAFMDTPLINGTPYPTVTVEPKTYRFRVLNAANDRMIGLSLYTADPAHDTEVLMIPATPETAALGPKDANGLPLWPSDGRDGGVVDYNTMGPDIIQIGTESGFLPKPVVIPPQATTYNYNRRDIVVLNVANHGLFLGPAERADILIDFSAYAGKTLILYNDMLAPVPAYDVRYDYFTGAPDQTETGGAPSTPIGYGPNTRTLMQIKVAGAAAPAFNKAALDSAFTSTPTTKSTFAEAQHLPIVPQTFYNSALNTSYAVDTYATIQANNLSYTKTENNLPTAMPLQPKAIQELFELNYGRMNATLGTELPFTNFNNQTTIPLGYTDPTTEVLKDGETQLWKITHNGVDTHPVHFHLFDVQIVNRVGWDGAVRFPDANEIGWKDTVKMNPLEDIVVALRPLSPRLPFALGNSTRSNDVTKQPTDSIWITDMTAPAPNQGNLGNQTQIVNATTSFGWEYVWHCHILGHEENDFMRPMQLNVANAVPADPTLLTATVSAPTRVDLAWTDNSTDEVGSYIERSIGNTNTFIKIGETVPDENHYSDMTAVAGTAYTYRVYGYNQAGNSGLTNTASVTPQIVTPASGVTLTASPANTAPFGTAVAFTATASGATGFQYQFLVNGAIVQDYSGVAGFTMPIGQPVGSYTVQVNVRTSTASAIVTATAPYTITPTAATGVQLLPNLPSPQASGIPVFTATGIGSTNYQYQFSIDNVVVQPYSATVTFKPAFLSAGAHQIKVDVRTNTASLVPDASTTLSYTITASTPATGVTVTTNLPSPQSPGTAVTFAATGIGSNSTDYLYRFYLGATLVQSGPASTWTMPASTPGGTYTIEVDVSSNTAVWSQAMSFTPYVLTVPITPATGVSVASSLASPQTAGTPVTFTATGLGSNTSAYLYRFYLGSTLVQSGTNNSWTLPASTPVGTYTIEVDVSSSGNVWSQAMTFASFTLNTPLPTPATGVTVTTDVPSPQNAGTPVIVTATGQGSNTSAYYYRFYFDGNLVQTGTNSTWTVPGTTPVGSHQIEVDVASHAGVWSQALTFKTFLIN